MKRKPAPWVWSWQHLGTVSLCSSGRCLGEDNIKSGVEASDSPGSIEIAAERLWPISWPCVDPSLPRLLLLRLPQPPTSQGSFQHILCASCFHGRGQPIRPQMFARDATSSKGCLTWREAMCHACMSGFENETHLKIYEKASFVPCRYFYIYVTTTFVPHSDKNYKINTNE